MTWDDLQNWHDEDLERYARHLVMPEIGTSGQKKLAQARVLIVGIGGLGNPMLAYLAAAGVATIGIIDDDCVERSNLHRQTLFDEGALGQKKTVAAERAIARLNPTTRITAYPQRLTTKNARATVADYDIVADGSDNFATRYLVNATCHALKKTLVSAACQGFEGHLATFQPWLNAQAPCYQCLFPKDHDNPADSQDTCARAGILGPIAGIMGSMQALEIIKQIVGITPSPPSSSGILLYDGLHQRLCVIEARKNPKCPLCFPTSET
ncbi:MAG: HesA/MoeB/ThiF family protein [Alphaproteobacteria bacterium GM202ARS2]|nr:HesA/MoeB/ThiF family protein [Alphaproteobacteria bacterium GM202ARS2]